MNPVEIESLNGMRVFITNMITKDVQARKHKKKRINKKWLKRYGLKILPDNEKVIATNEMLFMTRKCFERLNKEIKNGGSLMLKIGDKVTMNDKYYVSEKNRGKLFTVNSEPQDVCGTLSVWLDGFRGCYAVDGLDKVND